jgi:IMP cyclohydrolase
MYVGRVVAIGRSVDGDPVAAYRVSSRSFRDRRVRVAPDAVDVVPRVGFEEQTQANPYVSYRCLRLVAGCAIAGNGSHVDPIAERVAAGAVANEAIAEVLEEMGFERDEQRTPRIVGLVCQGRSGGWLGVVRHDALLVEHFELELAEVLYVATYERNYPSRTFVSRHFDARSAEEACEYMLNRAVFADFEFPVLAAAAFGSPESFAIAGMNVH